jgi:hypothetical protein
MTMKNLSTLSLVLILVGLVVLGSIFLALIKMIPQPEGSIVPVPTGIPSGITCTADAQLCPDGSYVGRTGADCHFEACPVPVPTSGTTIHSTTTVQVHAFENVTVNDSTLVPSGVTEDSRCPLGVMCIQAGTVRVTMQIVSHATSSTGTIMSLNTPIRIGDQTVTLTEVSPIKRRDVDISSIDYLFTLQFVK